MKIRHLIQAIRSYLNRPDPDEAVRRQVIVGRAIRNRERELQARELSEMAREREERP